MPGSEDSMAPQASPASKAGKPVLQRLFVRFQWVAIPLLILVAVECLLRKSDAAAPLWYSRAEAIARRGKVDFAFIGSSKVAAAFIEKAFNEEMGKALERRTAAVNLGRGFSSPQLHYLGLRNLLRRHPESLKGVTLFVEAMSDAPLYQYHGNWKSIWFNRQPELLVPLLRFPDLMPFWRSQGTAWTDKFLVTAKFLLGSSKIISHRERARHEFESLGKRMLHGFASRMFRLPPLPPAAEPVIQGIGGILTDPKDLERARKTGLKYYHSLAASRRPILNRWDGSVLADIVRLIKGQGGEVFFVNLPAYSMELKAYATPNHEWNKAIIRKQFKEWDVALLTPDFSYTDDDIPDCFHLKMSRAGEFSRKLARAYGSHGNGARRAELPQSHPISRFSNGNWRNGIHRERKNQFLLDVARDAPTPVRTGDRLKFAAAGVTRVQSVHRVEQGSHSLVFVRVNRVLDPAADGHPHWVEIIVGE